MKKGTERVYKGEGLVVYHQNIPKKQLKVHAHSEAHLFIPLEGTVELEIEGTVYPIPAGQMIFVPGNVPHSFHADNKSGERIILQFEERLQGLKSLRRPVLMPVHSLVKELVFNLFPHQDQPFTAAMENLIREVILNALTTQSKTAKNMLFLVKEKILASQDLNFRRVAGLLAQNMELTLEEVGKQAGLSARTLTRLIKAELDLPPKELQTYFRIERACELIHKDELNLTGIAYDCGYASLSQFITNFKKWTGQKPSEFGASH